MADALVFARASLESHGHMALEWLLCLVTHHDHACNHIDALLCPIHADFTEKFNVQLGMMKDCREWIERGELNGSYDGIG